MFSVACEYLEHYLYFVKGKLFPICSITAHLRQNLAEKRYEWDEIHFWLFLILFCIFCFFSVVKYTV